MFRSVYWATVDVSPGELSELLLKGPQVFEGCWDASEETEATLVPEGWHHTDTRVLGQLDGELSETATEGRPLKRS